MDDYINIINKMLRDKRKPEVIMSYIVKKGYSGSLRTLEKYITLFAKNNFNIRLTKTWAHISSYPDDVTIIKRNDLFKYMTTKNPKTKKSELVAQNFEIIKEKYSIVAILQEIYDEFYDILMGSIPDELDSFIHKYKDSVIETYIDRMITDIISIKNAISRHESSGFVEGNNNKFKLIKRILYGRANLANLFKKCYVAFKINAEDFDLTKLL